MPAAAGGHAERRTAAAVDLMREIDDARLVLAGGHEHHRAGAVAEQHARGAIGVVDDARHHVGADDQRVVGRPGRHDLHGGGQRIREARAGRAEVEAPRLRRADFCCSMHAVLGKIVSGVVVPTTMNPSLLGREARLAASRPRPPAARGRRSPRPGSTMCRSRMPVRCRIHSSDVSTIFSRSALVSTRGRHVRRQARDFHGPQLPGVTTVCPSPAGGQPEILVRASGGDAAPRRAFQKSVLNQERLVNVFDARRAPRSGPRPGSRPRPARR